MTELEGHGSNKSNTFWKAKKARTFASYGKNSLAPWGKRVTLQPGALNPASISV